MSTEETNARLLAEWLAAPAGTPPPEGLDTEVVAAVYAMRPDRAPAARVTLDEIFAAVTTGPFMEAASTAPSTTAPEAEFPAEAASAGRAQRNGTRRAAGEERGEVGRAERPAKRRPSRWWMAPAVGLSLAAAAALMLVIPVAGHYLSPSEGKMAEEAARSVTSAVEPTQAAPSAPMGGAPQEAPPVDSPDAALASRPVAIPVASPPPAEVKNGASEGWIPEMDAGQDALAQGSADPKTATEGRFADAAGDKSAAQTGTTSGKGGGGESAKDDLGGLGYVGARKEEAPKPPATPTPAPAATAQFAPPPPVSAPAPAAKPAPNAKPAPEPTAGIAEMESSRERVTEKKAAMDEDYGDGADVSLAKAPGAPAKPQDKAKVSTKTTATPAPSRSAGPSGAAGAPAPVASSGTKAVADAEMDDRDQEESAINPRDAAVPRDYAASWYSSRSDIAPAYAAADALRAAGKTEDAIKAWTALISNPDPNVGQDAAYRAAGLLTSDPNRALSLISQGMARGSANTPFRSNLLLLKGDLLMAEGSSAGARAAWAEAAKLNATR